MEKIEGAIWVSKLPQVKCPKCGVTYHLYLNRKSIKEKGYCYPCSKQQVEEILADKD